MTKSLTVNDARTGRSLTIEVDIEADWMKINGEEVERKRPLENTDDEFVYGPKSHAGPIAPEIYHVKKDQIQEIKSEWLVNQTSTDR